MYTKQRLPTQLLLDDWAAERKMNNDFTVPSELVFMCQMRGIGNIEFIRKLEKDRVALAKASVKNPELVHNNKVKEAFIEQKLNKITKQVMTCDGENKGPWQEYLLCKCKFSMVNANKLSEHKRKMREHRKTCDNREFMTIEDENNKKAFIKTLRNMYEKAVETWEIFISCTAARNYEKKDGKWVINIILLMEEKYGKEAAKYLKQYQAEKGIIFDDIEKAKTAWFAEEMARTFGFGKDSSDSDDSSADSLTAEEEMERLRKLDARRYVDAKKWYLKRSVGSVLQLEKAKRIYGNANKLQRYVETQEMYKGEYEDAFTFSEYFCENNMSFEDHKTKWETRNKVREEYGQGFMQEFYLNKYLEKLYKAEKNTPNVTYDPKIFFDNFKETLKSVDTRGRKKKQQKHNVIVQLREEMMAELKNVLTARVCWKKNKTWLYEELKALMQQDGSLLREAFEEELLADRIANNKKALKTQNWSKKGTRAKFLNTLLEKLRVKANMTFLGISQTKDLLLNKNATKRTRRKKVKRNSVKRLDSNRLAFLTGEKPVRNGETWETAAIA
jgi:hypothetical protein